MVVVVVVGVGGAGTHAAPGGSCCCGVVWCGHLAQLVGLSPMLQMPLPQ